MSLSISPGNMPICTCSPAEKPSLQSRHSLDSSKVQEKEAGPLWITLALQKQKGFREQQQNREERRSQREAKLAEKQARDSVCAPDCLFTDVLISLLTFTSSCSSSPTVTDLFFSGYTGEPHREQRKWQHQSFL